MIYWSCIPVAYIVASPLADRIFEPLMAADGLLAGSVGQIIGAGPSRGIGLLFIYDKNSSHTLDICSLTISSLAVCRTQIARCYLVLGESCGVSVLPGGRSLFLGLWY